MRSCRCGFVAPEGVPPWSPEFHRGHKEAHLARYPNVDAGTREALDALISAAERGAIRPVVSS